MSRVYDSWERLVAAILNREQLRYLALCESFNTSISADFSSRFSFCEDETSTAEHIEFEELKKATKNFRPYSNFGQGPFGHFSKGWIDENTLTATKPGFETAVTVEKWSAGGHQAIKECFLEFNAKLCNFGLAMKGPMGNRTEVMGRCGYAAPESFATGRRLTTKCDVYGFGVVLVELLTGRKSIDENRPINEYNLVDWATPYLRRKKNLSRIMDPKIEGQFPHKAAFAVATIALQCLSQMPEERPRMAEVLVALEQL